MKNSIIEFGEYSSLIRMDFKKINFLMGTVHIFFLFTFIILDVPLLLWTNLVMIGLHAFYLLLIKRNYFLLFYGCIFIQMTGMIVLTTIALGWASGFQHYLVIFPTFVFMVVHGWQKYAVVIISGSAYFWLYQSVPEVTGAVSEQMLQLFYIGNIGWVLLVLVFISNLYGKTTQKVLNELNDLSRIDPLTKSLNRRSMYQYLNKAKTNQRQSYLLLADLDDFKSINDQWGHECGDMALVHCAEIFHSFTKGTGKVARWGGEEFLLLLHAADDEEAFSSVRAIADAVSGANKFIYEQKEVPLSITGGLIKLDAAAHTEKMIHAADEALYLGKQQGKNQIVWADMEINEEEQMDTTG